MAPANASLALAARFARRELRTGLKGFRIVLACLAIGVATIAASGSFRAAVNAGVERDAQALLGGDLEVELLYREASPVERDTMNTLGRVSAIADLRAMVRPAEGGERLLVALKAVDSAYPLYGVMRLAPDLDVRNALALQNGFHGAVVAPGVLERLGLSVGDRLTVGEIEVEIRAAIEKEPDDTATVLQFGPRTMISLSALRDSDLMQPGALIEHEYRIALRDGLTAADARQRIVDAFPDTGWSLRGLDRAAPGLDRFFRNITMFLTVVGLTALLVGGIGVANGVKAFLDNRIATIATLKCLGAPQRLIFRIYLLQVMAIALVATLIGVAIGAILPPVVLGLVEEFLPAAAGGGVFVEPLALAGLFGLLTALAFALYPLAKARTVPGASLFRAVITPDYGRAGAGAWAGIGLIGGILAAAAIATSAYPHIALVFVLGAAGAMAVFRLAALGAAHLARLMAENATRGAVKTRLALANLYRPGAPTVSVVLSMGLGLTVLVAVALIETNLNRNIRDQIPERAPAFFFIDLQPDQKERFEAIVAGIDGADIQDIAPMLRGWVTELNGTPVDTAMIDPDVRWVVRGDRGVTMAAEPPANATVVAGSWWPADYSGPPLVSLGQRIADGLGLGVGDSLTVNILGRPITAEIAALRTIDWSSLEMNFTIIASPGALAGAPYTYIATVAADPDSETAVEQAVADALPNVSAIRVRNALESITEVLETAGLAVRSAAFVTLIAGALVLAGALAAGRRRRLYDAVVLKVLGAKRGDIAGTYFLEFGGLGLATAVIATALGTLAAWAVITYLLPVGDWQFAPSVAALTASASLAITLIAGFAATWRALGLKAAPYLRNE